VAKLGVESRVIVLAASELAAIVEENPLLDVAKDHSRMMVGVLAAKSDRAKLVPLLEEKWAPDALALGKRAAYYWCPGGIIDSRLAQAIGRLLRDATTARNWATILKLHALAQAKE